MLLCVSIVNELCLATLVSDTSVIFLNVIVSRYLLVLCGAHFWLLGSVIVLLATSAQQCIQIVNLYLPSPASMVAAIYGAMTDLEEKEVKVRRQSMLARQQFELSLREEEAMKDCEGEVVLEGEIHKTEGGVLEMNASQSAPAPALGSILGNKNPAINVTHKDLSFVAAGDEDIRNELREADKREQFRLQFYSLMACQTAIAICMLVAQFATAADNLYVFAILGSSQVLWACLLWMMAVTVLFIYLVRHCVLSGGFGSVRALLHKVTGIDDGAIEDAITSINTTFGASKHHSATDALPGGDLISTITPPYEDRRLKDPTNEGRDNEMTDDEFLFNYGCTRSEMEFVERARKGLSRETGEMSEKRLLKAIQGKRQKRVGKERKAKKQALKNEIRKEQQHEGGYMSAEVARTLMKSTRYEEDEDEDEDEVKDTPGISNYKLENGTISCITGEKTQTGIMDEVFLCAVCRLGQTWP